MITLLIREMLPHERALVLSDWKKDLWETKPDWGKALRSEEWWALVNHVVDNISLPSSTVWMACHRDEESVPIAWLAERKKAVLWSHATRAVNAEIELAAYLHDSLLRHAGAQTEERFNPFTELRQQCRSSH